jgi:hypothetical protein
VPQFASVVQTQNPSVQVPCAPHWPSVEHVPHVPWTQAIPPPHWLLAVQFVQAPSTHANPEGGPNCPYAGALQSAKVAHGLQVPWMHARPFLHPKGLSAVGPQPPSTKPRVPSAQTPDEQTSSEGQSVSAVHVHCIPTCVPVQIEAGPHCAFDEHAVQAWFTQTWPALHWLFDVHVEQPLVHGMHVS